MRRLAPVLVAFLFALAAMLPAGLRAMPSVSGMGMTQDCPACSQPSRNRTAPDRMQVCPTPACAAAIAVLPLPAHLPDRAMLAAVHPQPRARAWRGAPPAPDPLPPRPIALL